MKLYLSALITALLLVTGQGLWKVGGTRLATRAHDGWSIKLLADYGTWIILGGLAIYAVATVIYIALLSSNRYFTVQASIVGFSLVLATLSSLLIFHEALSARNYAGVFLLLVGTLLVTAR